LLLTPFLAGLLPRPSLDGEEAISSMSCSTFARRISLDFLSLSALSSLQCRMHRQSFPLMSVLNSSKKGASCQVPLVTLV
jgi:hypothetical protein